MTTLALDELDEMVAELAAAKDRWAVLPVSAKIDLMDRVRDGVLRVAEDWVAAAAKAKGLADGSRLVGEEWLSGPYALLGWLADIRVTLAAVQRGEDPLRGFDVTERADEQAVVHVFPHGVKEALLLHGTTAQVWMQPGLRAAGVSDHAAAAYRDPHPAGAVALVLGAGNISSIAPLDALYKLYADGQVVLVKLNPVNDYLGPMLEQAFAPLVTEGYLRFAYGDGEVGAYLCRHPDIDTIHITGSASTHDAIVYGSGAAAADRKSRDERLLDKPITSELGGVGPTIVVPGPWTGADFRFQAEHLVTQKLHNNGHNCIASQVLVLPSGWDGSTRLLQEIQRVLAEVEPRPAYYPRSAERRANALRQYPDAVETPSCLLVTGVDPADTQAFAFREEFFGPVWAVTELPAPDPATFLRNAVRFANDTLDGTLGANLVIDPRTERKIAPQLDEAIATLRYGTVAVNGWTAVGYLLGRATWGAFPGHTYGDVQSGIGVVHNALLLDGVQKTVVRAPFRNFPRSLRHASLGLAPRPPWFVTNTTAARTARRLAFYAGDGKLRRLPGIFASALHG